MIHKLILFVFILLLPTFASAESIVLHTLNGNSKAPYEPVPIAEGAMFDDAAELFTVDFIDRGAADCILLRCGGESLLVDGGKYALYDHLKNVFSYLDLTHFTYMLNTHAHDDHIEGLISLLKREYTADEYMSCYPDNYNGSEYQIRIQQLLADKGIPYHQITDGDQFSLGKADITVYRDETPNIDKNRHSILLRIVFGERSVLLMADAGGWTQEYLLERYGPNVFNSDVLKYPHHGYVNMTHAFLAAVDPAVVVITNSRPSAELADKQLSQLGVPRYYTNQGVVRMQTDGHVWHVEQMPWRWPLDTP